MWLWNSIQAFSQDPANWLDHHVILTYFVVLVWTFIEGETIVIVAGFAASDWTPNPFLVMLSAFLGSLAGDQTWFYVGRLKGKAFLARRPTWQQRADKVLAIFERHHTLLILGFRFLYGLRNVTPFALGTSNVKSGRFLFLNMIGAAVWAVAFTLAGMIFGLAAEKFLKDFKAPVIIGMIVLFAGIWGFRVWSRKRKARALAAQATVSPEQPNTPA